MLPGQPDGDIGSGPVGGGDCGGRVIVELLGLSINRACAGIGGITVECVADDSVGELSVITNNGSKVPVRGRRLVCRLVPASVVGRLLGAFGAWLDVGRAKGVGLVGEG